MTYTHGKNGNGENNTKSQKSKKQVNNKSSDIQSQTQEQSDNSITSQTISEFSQNEINENAQLQEQQNEKNSSSQKKEIEFYMSDDVDSERFNKSVDELTMESLKNANYVVEKINFNKQYRDSALKFNNKFLLKSEELHVQMMEALMGGLYDHFAYNSQTTKQEELLTKDEWVASGLLNNSIFIKDQCEIIDKSSIIRPELKEYRIQITKNMIQSISANMYSQKPQNLLDWSLYLSDHMSVFTLSCLKAKKKSNMMSLKADQLYEFMAQIAKEEIKFNAYYYQRIHEIINCIKIFDLEFKDFIRISLSSMQFLQGKIKF